MKLHQLSLFLENRPGHLRKACQILAEACVNVETMMLADTERFGILRILVKDWQNVKKALEGKNLIVKEVEVIAIKLADQPGELARLLAMFDPSDVNIEYMYGFNSRALDAALIVLRVDNTDKALQIFQKNGVSVVKPSELFEADEKTI